MPKTTAFIFINMSVEILCVSKASTARKNEFMEKRAKFPGYSKNVKKSGSQCDL